jgi:MFS family permease
MGVIYFVFMMIGAFAYRVTPDGWQPEGWTPPSKTNAMISGSTVHLDNAHKTPQFWLLWLALCMNVSAGIGVLAVASPMLQEIFAGALIGKPEIGFAALEGTQKVAVATIAAGFVGLLSLFNIGGRFFWATMSDYIGRKTTYYVFFILGILLYSLVPSFAHMGSRALFVGAFCIILTMYGGGFSTIPAYLADLFGAQFVGAIHGRLLTAWSAAGVIGPLLVGYIRDAQLQAGVQRSLVYDRTMYILVGLLVIGLICNLLVRPVAAKWHLSKEEAARLHAESAENEAAVQHGSYGIGKGGLDLPAGLFWLFVGIPLLWGVWMTLQSAVKIF